MKLFIGDYMTKLKFFSLMVLFSLILFNSNACTKETNDKEQKMAASDNNKGYMFAANNAGNPKVIDIESVEKARKGKAVDFTWKDGGKTYSFSEYTKGKVVFLNFWATWCGPCKMEIPDIIELDKELPDKDFVVIGIATDNRGTLGQVRKLVQGFAKSRKITYINFLTTKDIISPYGGLKGVPTTFIIDKKGNIVERIVGARSKADFLKSIKRAMNS